MPFIMDGPRRSFNTVSKKRFLIKSNTISKCIFSGAAPNIVTRDTEVTLKNLPACSMIYAVVRIKNATVSNWHNIPRIFNTHYDELRPVRNVRTHYVNDLHAINITWEHSCRLHNQHPPAYNITIIDTVTSISNFAQVPSTSDDVQSYLYHNVTTGGVYSIRFASIVNHSEPYDGVFVAPPLPTPSKIDVQMHDENEVVQLTWPNVKFNETS